MASSPSPPLLHFHVFPNLPVELRLKIWSIACNSSPRIVEVCTPVPLYDWEELGKEDEDATSQPESECESNSSQYLTQTSEPELSKYYTPTPHPPLLSATHESRTIAQTFYGPQFVLPSTTARIYFNPSIDILFFPAWCWESGISNFEADFPVTTRSSIRKLAVENLIWYGGEGGSINGQVQIDEWRGLEEFYFIFRLPDSMGCGCAHDFERENEKGVPEFREVDRRIGLVRDGEEILRRTGDFGVVEQLEEIKKGDGEWQMPEFIMRDLWRDGVRM
ncbi:hypothetical protein GLAREA_04802 [Glarea lozoyensis ATCC 20868]|uniref:2EXR domain-containing protein n=1 Tax=Glarea lozoyensis (strain ATCC 20868 / MF5171) TaxID=1116229 RepID=S3D7M1_GLAL2|nr:uncharacterized protein GLAREA_04802 [Glarea lozoyensis ATCC 20868]EPE28011.1 hypothetical protein GLAREA_04802 [Glarea lozoyensis ATCC 20868]